jgi:hypothetical protein
MVSLQALRKDVESGDRRKNTGTGGGKRRLEGSKRSLFLPFSLFFCFCILLLLLFGHASHSMLDVLYFVSYCTKTVGGIAGASLSNSDWAQMQAPTTARGKSHPPTSALCSVQSAIIRVG